MMEPGTQVDEHNMVVGGHLVHKGGGLGESELYGDWRHITYTKGTVRGRCIWYRESTREDSPWLIFRAPGSPNMEFWILDARAKVAVDNYLIIDGPYPTLDAAKVVIVLMESNLTN